MELERGSVLFSAGRRQGPTRAESFTRHRARAQPGLWLPYPTPQHFWWLICTPDTSLHNGCLLPKGVRTHRPPLSSIPHVPSACLHPRHRNHPTGFWALTTWGSLPQSLGTSQIHGSRQDPAAVLGIIQQPHKGAASLYECSLPALLPNFSTFSSWKSHPGAETLLSSQLCQSLALLSSRHHGSGTLLVTTLPLTKGPHR